MHEICAMPCSGLGLSQFQSPERVFFNRRKIAVDGDFDEIRTEYVGKRLQDDRANSDRRPASGRAAGR